MSLPQLPIEEALEQTQKEYAHLMTVNHQLRAEITRLQSIMGYMELVKDRDALQLKLKNCMENFDIMQAQYVKAADEVEALRVMVQYSELLKERQMLLTLLTAVNDYRHLHSAAESGADAEAARCLPDSYINLLLKADLVEAHLDAGSVKKA